MFATSVPARLAIIVLVCVASVLRAQEPTPQPNVVGQLPQIGNGFIATGVTAPAQFLAGVYNGFNTSSKRAALPATTAWAVFCDASQGPSSTHAMTLDFETATVSQTGTCATVSWRLRWYAHRTRRALYVVDWLATNAANATSSVSVTLSPAGVNGNATGWFATLVNSTYTTDSGSSGSSSRSSSTSSAGSSNSSGAAVGSTVTSWLLQTLVPEQTWMAPTDVGVSFNNPFGDTVDGGSVVVAPGGTSEALMVTAHCTSVDPAVPAGGSLQCSQNVLADALADGSAALRAEHLAGWADLWSHRISVRGKDADLVTAVTASQYALLSNLRADWPFGPSPGGIGWDCYSGHSFWDGETWMIPNLVLFWPDVARAAYEYRRVRLPGAMAKAASLGFEGAMFPWESALSGYEVCPWPQGAQTEIHVTADIVYSIANAFRVFGDTAWLSTFVPVLNETANFWLSRVTQDNVNPAVWHINGVTPPDEYHFGNDSVYTNNAVSTVLRFVLEASSLLGFPVQDAARMRAVADGLAILFNATSNVHPEFFNYTGGMVKQADAVLMPFPWGRPMPASHIRSDLDYYFNRTDPHGPAMTWAMFGVGYLSIGALAEGEASFRRGFEANVLPPYSAWYENVGAHGCQNFITGAGGFLQSLWAGLGGVRILDQSLRILSVAHLPSGTHELRFEGLVYRGATLRLVFRRLRRHGRFAPLRLSVELLGLRPVDQQQGSTSVVVVNGTQTLRHVGDEARVHLADGDVDITVASA